jgi:hypothetical protein
LATAATSRMEQLKRHRVSHRFALLLASQFALIAIHPLAAREGSRPGWFGIFAMAVFLAGLYQVVEKRRIRTTAVLLCVPAVSGSLLTLLGYTGRLLIPAAVFAILFVAFITAVLLWTVISSVKVTTETLYGAVAAYLFIGIVWGMAYSLVEQLSPGSLRFTFEAGRQLTWPDYSFFSFVTLTTIGYGDVVPIGGVKALVMIEGIIGAMYAPILIGRLLTLYPHAANNSTDLAECSGSR